MKVRDALKLRPGDKVTFGPRGEREGKVAFVTPSGAAVKVLATDGRGDELVLSADLHRRGRPRYRR